jgi:hypothetical protein
MIDKKDNLFFHPKYENGVNLGPVLTNGKWCLWGASLQARTKSDWTIKAAAIVDAAHKVAAAARGEVDWSSRTIGYDQKERRLTLNDTPEFKGTVPKPGTYVELDYSEVTLRDEGIGVAEMGVLNHSLLTLDDGADVSQHPAKCDSEILDSLPKFRFSIAYFLALRHLGARIWVKLPEGPQRLEHQHGTGADHIRGDLGNRLPHAV